MVFKQQQQQKKKNNKKIDGTCSHDGNVQNVSFIIHAIVTKLFEKRQTFWVFQIQF